jgi:hypothetical protein
MIIAAIVCIGLAGQIRGGIVSVAAAKLPSASSSWGRNNNANYRSNPDDDIPIVGEDHFRDRSKKGVGRSTLGKFGRRSKRELKRRRRDDDIAIDDDEPLPFFFEQNEFDHDDDDDGWPQREYYDRRHRRRKPKISHHHHLFDSFRHWALETTGIHIPRINLHLHPITIIKMRKAWPNLIPGAIVRVGADFETRGVWRLRGCIEDKLIGGRFTIKKMKYIEEEEEQDNRVVLLEYSKSWLIPGAGELVALRQY